MPDDPSRATPPPADGEAPAGPYIPASTILPEITVKAVLLGIGLSVLLGAANAYLGLFAGMTVSASIPAAVLSMALLRLFRQSNILENNLVQTAASAGESLAAGVIFTLPALIILGTWEDFHYWEVVLISGLGGLLGVLFTIPLRRALIVESPLRFPEGVATAEVLKVGEGGAGAGIRALAVAGLVGALFKLGATGLRLVASSTAVAGRVGGGALAYVGTNLSPALVGVGYIVGLNIAVLIFLGGAFNWWVVIPILSATGAGAAGGDAVAAAGELWGSQTRYMGVGAMAVGGLWALVKLRSSLAAGIRSGLAAYRASRGDDAVAPLRTERDLPMPWVLGALVLAVVPLFFLFERFTGSPGVAAVMAGAMLVAGFLFAAVAGYMAGLVGSSNNPISGVTIATLLVASLLLLWLLGSGDPTGPAAAIFVGAVVASAAAIAGDNMQDLKAGHLLGSTPIKQQVMQAIGVAAAAFAIAPVLSLLLAAYGIGEPSAEHPEPLAAPQATLMAAVARGVFTRDLPWAMVILGAVVAVAVILLDIVLERRGSAFRTPVLAVAVGIYLPLELEVPIFLGGLLAWFAGRAYTRAGAVEPAGGAVDPVDQSGQASLAEARRDGERRGLLFAAGLITGEALLGILLAIPIVVWGTPERPEPLAVWGPIDAVLPGLALFAVVIYLLYRAAVAPLAERRAR